MQQQIILIELVATSQLVSAVKCVCVWIAIFRFIHLFCVCIAYIFGAIALRFAFGDLLFFLPTDEAPHIYVRVFLYVLIS